MAGEQLERLSARFARAARGHGEALEAMDEVVAARQAALLAGLAQRLLAAGQPGIAALKDLARGGEPLVAGMAAVYLLNHAAAEALPVLRRLAAGEGLLAFRARFALERWERGEWD